MLSLTLSVVGFLICVYPSAPLCILVLNISFSVFIHVYMTYFLFYSKVFFFCVREIFVSCLSFHDLLLISAVDCVCVCVCTWPCLPFGLCVVCVVVSTFLVPDA